MADRTNVAVIGAGVIGLSCARELAGAGVNVTVLEAAEAAPDEPGPVADDRPPPPPIAEAFAASSEAEKKKRGRFRR